MSCRGGGQDKGPGPVSCRGGGQDKGPGPLSRFWGLVRTQVPDHRLARLARLAVGRSGVGFPILGGSGSQILFGFESLLNYAHHRVQVVHMCLLPCTHGSSCSYQYTRVAFRSKPSHLGMPSDCQPVPIHLL